MQRLHSKEQLPDDKNVRYSQSPATSDLTNGIFSPQSGEATKKIDTGNIELAETSLRESGSLNYEEARALLGRYEYQKGNIEAALHVFEGIDIAAITSKMKITLSLMGETHRRRSQKFAAPPMSIHAINLLFEAIFLKAKCLEALRRYKEAARLCTIILDLVESSSPLKFPGSFGPDCKLQETFNKAVELLPELWKLADHPTETISAYRRALLHTWTLDARTTAKIQKEFASFLLYSGTEAVPPQLWSQIDNSFVPRNNIEETILLLIILLRKVSLKRIEWDPSILDHLTFALSLSGGLMALANQVEELVPGVVDKKEMDYVLALCYQGEGDDSDALELWKRLSKNGDDFTRLQALLFASKICSADPKHVEDGVSFARRADENSQRRCDQMRGAAKCALGLALSASCNISVITDRERIENQSESLKCLETAAKITKMMNPDVIYNLCLENAVQRKLEPALSHAKRLVEMESGSDLRGWILLSRILSAQKRFSDGEAIIDAAIDQSSVWDRAELLRTKAKLQIAQGFVKEGVETYSQLLALLQLQSKSFFGSGKKLKGSRDDIKNLEQETWHDLASVYTRLSRWHDAEICLLKSDAISAFSASRWHATGLLHEARDNQKEALKAYELALEVDPKHVPSLVSMATVLRKVGCKSREIVRSFLTDALRHDRMNSSAWYIMGLAYSDDDADEEGISNSSLEAAAECFVAAEVLQETEPIEPFR